MIVSASYRTDIPAYFGAWFRARLAAGECSVRNPYGGAPYRVSLAAQDIDGFVFWTKNARPFADTLSEVGDRGYPFIVQYSINALPRALERNRPDRDAAIDDVRRIAAAHGQRAAVWRYDPIVFSDATSADWHRQNFAGIATSLRGTTDEVVVSAAHIYRKSRRNMDRAASEAGISWRDPPLEEKSALIGDLSAIAADNDMRLTICSQPDIAAAADVPLAACIDAARLSDVAGQDIRARQKGNRPGCLCAESRDIGAYDTCPMGCAYCYAVSDPDRTKRAFDQIREDGKMLGAPETPSA